MTIRAISTIAFNTYRETVRSKILYAVLFVAVFMVAVAACFGLVSVGDQIKIIQDFGLFAISFAAAANAILTGGTLLNKELTRKTIYNILSRPIPRWQFVFGKFFGLLISTLTMTALLTVLLAGSLYPSLKGESSLLFWAFAYNSLEVLITCAVVIFFSCIVVTPVLSGLFAFGLFLAGRSAEQLLYFVQRGEASQPMRMLLEGLHKAIPNLAELNISNSVVYGITPSLSHFYWAITYSIGYSALLLIIGSAAFSRRDFN